MTTSGATSQTPWSTPSRRKTRLVAPCRAPLQQKIALDPLQVEDCVIFWNTSTDEKHPKHIRNLITIASCKDLCLLAGKLEDEPSQVCPSPFMSCHAHPPSLRSQCMLLLCDALGTPVDSRHVNMGNSHHAMPDSM